MDGNAPQASPLLLQLSNTASNEARRHWLLEKRLTAPLPGAAAEYDAAIPSGEGVQFAEARFCSVAALCSALTCCRARAHLQSAHARAVCLCLRRFLPSTPGLNRRRLELTTQALLKCATYAPCSALALVADTQAYACTQGGAPDAGRSSAAPAARANVPASDGSAVVQVRRIA
jgi:hypothetical protein